MPCRHSPNTAALQSILPDTGGRNGFFDVDAGQRHGP